MAMNPVKRPTFYLFKRVVKFSLAFTVNSSTADLKQLRDIQSAHYRQNLPFGLPEFSNLGAKPELNAVWSYDINCCLISSTCD